MEISLFQRQSYESGAKSAAKHPSDKRIYLKWHLKRSPLKTSISRLFVGMARLVAVNIKKNGRNVKRRLFVPYFGITFASAHITVRSYPKCAYCL
jgi:hypothetical protein